MKQSAVEKTTDSSQLIEQKLNEFFDYKINQASEIHSNYLKLWKELKKLTNSGGKRIRPKIMLLSYQAFGGKEISKILDIAVAQELLHGALLIHDDIIDRDEVRYGVKNIAGQYKNHYQAFSLSKDNTNHYANSAAILAGDLLIAGALQLIATSEVSSPMRKKAAVIMDKAIFEVAAGELLDTESAFLPSGEVDSITIARYKTASYSFISPIVTGATLAGADDTTLLQLGILAENLGIAFQLKDDLLSIFGNEELTGKSSSSDITEGKHTFMVEQLLESANSKDIDYFNEHFGNLDATNEQIEQMKSIFIESGAKEKTEQMIEYYEKRARVALSAIELKPEYHEQFDALIDKSLRRTK